MPADRAPIMSPIMCRCVFSPGRSRGSDARACAYPNFWPHGRRLRIIYPQVLHSPFLPIATCLRISGSVTADLVRTIVSRRRDVRQNGGLEACRPSGELSVRTHSMCKRADASRPLHQKPTSQSQTQRPRSRSSHRIQFGNTWALAKTSAHVSHPAIGPSSSP